MSISTSFYSINATATQNHSSTSNESMITPSIIIQGRSKNHKIIKKKQKTNVFKNLQKLCYTSDIVMKYIVAVLVRALLDSHHIKGVIPLYCLQVILRFKFNKQDQLYSVRQIACAIFFYSIKIFGKGHLFDDTIFFRQFNNLNQSELYHWFKITKKYASGILIFDLIKQNNKKRIVCSVEKLIKQQSMKVHRFNGGQAKFNLNQIFRQIDRTTTRNRSFL